jgi:purine-nucleoside/S-methyl-5'-thioadenosine phosphorylase / adenosine deaminase
VDWIEQTREGLVAIRPAQAPEDVVVAFSGRGHAPEDESTPTAYLARRFSRALGLDGTPIHWAHQVHGNAAATISAPGTGEPNAGHCDALATAVPGAALAVQTADCVPILLAGPGAVGAAHAGWRGSAKNVAAEAVRALDALGAPPTTLRAWIGPSIGPCCYEVGGDVAAQFAGDFLRAGCGGGYRLDLRAVNVTQLQAAGVPREAIVVHPVCTKCGGERLASYRRDGARAGRMIALIALLSPERPR